MSATDHHESSSEWLDVPRGGYLSRFLEPQERQARYLTSKLNQMSGLHFGI
jgi:hypothetical protein